MVRAAGGAAGSVNPDCTARAVLLLRLQQLQQLPGQGAGRLGVGGAGRPEVLSEVWGMAKKTKAWVEVAVTREERGQRRLHGVQRTTNFQVTCCSVD